MSDYKKYIFPAVFTVIGLIAVINGITSHQNGTFMLGAFAILLAGAVSLVASMVHLNKNLRLIISLALAVIVSGLAYSNYMSIKIPIEFQAEKVRRYAHVVEHLKDIRTAQLAYKAKYQKFQANGDSLVAFVKYDSIAFIKAIGEVPDTMSLEDAIKAGIATRDTLYVNVLDSLFVGKKEDRLMPFNPDSMIVVPFTGGARFDIQAGTVERSGVNVPVFQATDSKPFDPRDPMQVGSMSDPKTNGNWE
jgi:hypothetical protein